MFTFIFNTHSNNLGDLCLSLKPIEARKFAQRIMQTDSLTIIGSVEFRKLGKMIIKKNSWSL